MKTKNILLPAIALLAGTLLSTTASAFELDYASMEKNMQEISASITVTDNDPQKKYLDVQSLLDAMPNPYYMPADLAERAKNSIEDEQLTLEQQYDLISKAIETKHNDMLIIFLDAGFNPKADFLTGQTPFQALAVREDNEEGFGLVYVSDTEIILQTVNNLRNDRYLLATYLAWVNKYNQHKIERIDTPELKKIEKSKLNNESMYRNDSREDIMKQLKDSTLLEGIKSGKYKIDSIPAAEATIKVLP